MSVEACSCGSGKRPIGLCAACMKKYCDECKFTHQYTPPPMNTADFLCTSLGKKD